MDNINLDQVQTNPKMDLRSDLDDDLYSSITHSCKYYEPDGLHDKLIERDNNSLSYYSHNIRSLPAHWNDLCELLACLQEKCNLTIESVLILKIS